MQGIQAFLARSLPSATQNRYEDVRASVVNPLLPRVMPMAECPREDLDTVSLAASDSLVTDEHDCYLPFRGDYCTLCLNTPTAMRAQVCRDAGSSVFFSLHDTIKMVLVKLNLDLPPMALGP